MSEEHDKADVRRLWLVRHGATQWNSEQRFCGSSDVPLSELGHAQARWLAQFLHEKRIAIIYSSDLLRARQTAGIIAGWSRHPVQIRASAAWREIDFGAWEGLTYSEIAERFGPHQASFFSDPVRFSPPGGETFGDLVARVRAGFAGIIQDIVGASTTNAWIGNIVLVSHGGPLRALLCCILKMPLERQWQLRLDPGSLSAIDFLPVDDAMDTATLALLNVQGSGVL